MGMFDDDDYDDDFGYEPEPSSKKKKSKEPRGSKMSRDHGVSRGDMFRNEFSWFGNWTGKQVIIVLVLLVVAGIVFVSKFGSDPGTISDRVKNQLGVPAQPKDGTIKHASSVSNISLEFQDGKNYFQGNAKIIGLKSPGKCYTSTKKLQELLPDGASIQVVFSPKLGRNSEDNKYLVRIKRKSNDVGLSLLRAGAAKVDTKIANEAGRLKEMNAAQKSAKRANRGLWKTC